MNNPKAIITKFRVEYYKRETDPIFDSENIYDLKEGFQFPDESEMESFCVGNIFLFEEKNYIIRDFSIETYNPNSGVRDFNLFVIIYVEDVNE